MVLLIKSIYGLAKLNISILPKYFSYIVSSCLGIKNKRSLTISSGYKN